MNTFWNVQSSRGFPPDVIKYCSRIIDICRILHASVHYICSLETSPHYHKKLTYHNQVLLGANLRSWQKEGQIFAPCWSSCVTSDTPVSQCQVKPLWRAAITIPRSGHLNWSVIINWTQQGSVWSRMTTWQAHKSDRYEWMNLRWES